MPDTSELTVGRPTSIAQLQRDLDYLTSPAARCAIVEDLADELGREPDDEEVDARLEDIRGSITTTIETMAEQASW